MSTPFIAPEAVDWVINIEGGYVNNPADPGGETKYGIAKRFHPGVDIANLTVAQARTIMIREYWAPCRCDLLSNPIAFFVFDTAVNDGVSIAAMLLQECVGVRVDHIIGPITARAAGQRDPVTLLEDLAARRALLYFASPNFGRFGLGWMRRTFAATIAAAGAGHGIDI